MSRQHNDDIIRCGQCGSGVHHEEALHCIPIDENICPRCMDEFTTAVARIREIDDWFEAAEHWGSWMAGMSIERDGLALKWGQERRWVLTTTQGI
jgi:hypothetical protein